MFSFASYKSIRIKRAKDVRKEVDAVKETAMERQISKEAPTRYNITLAISFNDMSQWERPTVARAIAASDLAVLISRSPGDRLQSLDLTNVRIEGDLSLVTNVLATCQYLKRVSFANLQSTLDIKETLSAMGQALAMANPENFRMDVSDYGPDGFRSCDLVLAPVLKQPNDMLKSIYISGFSSEDTGSTMKQSASRFVEACRACNSLESLDLFPFEGSFSSQVVDAMISLIPTLKRLSIVVQESICISPFAEALKGNPSFDTLEIGRYGETPSEIIDTEVQAFYALLDDNFAVTKLQVGNWPDSCSDPDPEDALAPLVEGIEFYLSMNKKGRARLLMLEEGGKRDDWMDVIAYQDDPSNIYNFLRKNPSSCIPQTIDESWGRDAAKKGRRSRKRRCKETMDDEKDKAIITPAKPPKHPTGSMRVPVTSHARNIDYMATQDKKLKNAYKALAFLAAEVDRRGGDSEAILASTNTTLPRHSS